jgi:hypothetical protein
MRLLVCALAVVSGIACPSIALADGMPTQSNDLGKDRLDLSVPDIPAFTALGVSPSTISRPDNIKDLVSSLASGVTAAGTIQSGLALEVSPQKLLGDVSVLRAPWAYTFLSGLRISAATNAVTASPTTQNNARTFFATAGRYGFSTYQPENDPLLQQCLTAALSAQLAKVTPAPPPPPTPATPAAPGSEVVIEKPTLITIDDVGKCRDVMKAANLAPDFAIEVAYAHSEVALNSAKVGDFHPNVDSVWLSVTYGGIRSFKQSDLKAACGSDDPACTNGWDNVLKKVSKAASRAWAFAPIAFLRLDDSRISPATSTDREVDVYLAGRLPLTSDGWSVFVEGGHKFIDVSKKNPAATKDSTPAGIGAELRLANGTWLGLYASADLQSGAILSLGNIKWSIGDNKPF